ncbi:MAG: Cyanophycin synthetase [Candidatus Saccharibacteria bacterium]|nr:Cyanophycin synthetase [Candidatus Saccharibacteria bacterium]
MIDVADYGVENLRMTLRMIAEEALGRGWQAFLYRPGSAHMRLIRPDSKVIEMFGSAPDTTSYVASHMADDKYVTNIKLAEQNLPIIPSELVRKGETGQEFVQKLFNQGKQGVVKPSNGSHGQGITTGIRDDEQLQEALAAARQYSGVVLAQEYLQHRVDIRVLCINYKVVAALIRRPARIQGDGHSTVAELIAVANTDPRRGLNYAKELNMIDMIAAERFLGDRLRSVPAEGEWYQAVGTANVGTGGETIDVTADMPDFLIGLSEKAAKAMQLPVCGVDFLLQGLPTLDATAQQLDPMITEVNKAPALYIHETPTEGSIQPVIADLFDYLETV